MPDERQELLLRIALSDDADAVALWRRWKAERGTVDADVTDLELLPLVWRRISRLDPSDSGVDWLRGTYRYTWVKNQRLMRGGAEALQRLEAAGIPTMVLKGAALNVLGYRDFGVRLMNDFDVLVPRDSAMEAISLLAETMEPEQPRERLSDRVKVHHSTEFSDGPDRNLDLHWYSLWQSAPDQDFWEAGVPIEVFGARSLALCATDQLLQTCAHGAAWEELPMSRWVIDAGVVLRSEGGVDWDRFVSQGRKRELGLTLADALSYLRDTVVPSIPAEVIGELRSAPSTPSERLARRASTRPTTMLGALAIHWDRYRRLRRLDPGGPRASSFPAHLRTWWGFDTYREFAGYAIRRALGGRDARRAAAARGVAPAR